MVRVHNTKTQQKSYDDTVKARIKEPGNFDFRLKCFLFPVKNNCSWYRVLNLLLYKMCWIHYEDELCCELIAVLIKHTGCGWRKIPAGKATVFCFLPSTRLAPVSVKSLIRIFKNQFDLSAWRGSFIWVRICPNFRLAVVSPLVLLCGVLLYRRNFETSHT